MEKKHEEDECHQRDIFTKRTLWKLSFMFEMILSLFWWGRFERYWWWKKKRSHCCRLLFRQRQYKSDGYRFFSTIFILFTFLVFVCVFYFYFSDICCFSIYPKERRICCCFTFVDPFRSLPDSLCKAHHYFIISL